MFFRYLELRYVVLYDLYDFFFFFKQKTAYEMRISDWSSDVCSSDLRRHQRARRHAADEAIAFDQQRPCAVAGRRHGSDQPGGAAATDDDVIAATDGHLAAWYADRRILFEYRGHTSSTGQFGWFNGEAFGCTRAAA